MKKFASRRKGFTLVELLIVIVVIGILSAMMMLSSSEAVSSAKATAIVSDLRNLKTAALAYFADNADKYITISLGDNLDLRNSGDELDQIFTYLNGKDFPNKDSYTVMYRSDKKSWYAECNLSKLLKGSEQTSVMKKLAGRAKSVGLSGCNGVGVFGDGTSNNANYVTMLVE